jgi:hypothetical protein
VVSQGLGERWGVWKLRSESPRLEQNLVASFALKMIESLSDLKEFLSTYYLIHATVRRGL